MASLNELKMSMTHYTMAYSRDKYYFVEQISNRYGFPIMNYTVFLDKKSQLYKNGEKYYTMVCYPLSN